jgi:hypothetical protein
MTITTLTGSRSFLNAAPPTERCGRWRLPAPSLKMRFASEEERQKHLQQFHAEEGSRELLARLVQEAN